MITSAEKLLDEVETAVEEVRETIKLTKDDIENLTNRIKVEKQILKELEQENPELHDVQKYVVMALDDELLLESKKLLEQETGLKLLYKKSEVLSRGSWFFNWERKNMDLILVILGMILIIGSIVSSRK